MSGYWCHMISDTNDLDELHAMADRLGLKRRWFQTDSSVPHYDLRDSKRRKAIEYGAREVGRREMGEIIMWLRNL